MFYDNLRALAYLLRRPLPTARYAYIFLRERMVEREARISRLLNVSREEVSLYFRELRQSALGVELKRAIAELKGLPAGGMTTRSRAPVIYAFCRLIKPEIVVETGVAAGVSSSYFLEALNRNLRGLLYSIDFPHPSNKLPTGWLVPDRLRDRWRLVLGKSSERLPSMLKQLGKVDIFMHDSDHSYENMMFEFRTAWSYIRNGGLLVSDDTHMNRSFFDFAGEVNRKPVRFYLLSAIRK